MYLIPGDVPIYQDFIPTSRANNPDLFMAPSGITVHDTGNSKHGANAKAHAGYLKGSAAAAIPASWHYTVDDRVIYQHLPNNRVGWHCGDGYSGHGNRRTIGVEICINRDGDINKAEANAIWLIVKLILENRSIDPLIPSCIYQHNFWSNKNCPAIIRARPSGWERFVGAIKTNHTLKFSSTDAADERALDRVKKLESEIGSLREEIAHARRMIVNARAALTA